MFNWFLIPEEGQGTFKRWLWGHSFCVLTLAGWTSSWWPGLATGPEDAGMEVVKETGMRVRAALL